VLRFVLFCTLGYALSGAMLAQSGAQSPPTEPAPTIRATANEVALDLVVRDKRGHLIKNLKPGDVAIYEDGVKQEIQSLRLLAGAPKPVTPAATGDYDQPQTNQHPPLPLHTPNLMCIVFHNLDSNARKWGIQAVEEFVKNELRPGTWVGVFNLGSRLTPLHAFTTNFNEVLRAANNAFVGSTVDITRASEAVLNSTPNVQWLTGFVSPGGRGGGILDLSTTGSVATTAIVGADVDNGPGANAQRGDLVLEREQFIGVEGAREMDQIKLLIRQIGAFPGHKTVILLSAGLTTTGEPDQFQAMLNQANLADLTFYPFDAHGLSLTSTAQASDVALQHVTSLSQQQRVESTMKGGQTDIGSAGVVAELSRQDDYQRDAVRTSDPQAPLRELAEGTGGFLVANTDDLRKPFAQIVEEADTHYEADYHPSSGKYDGRFRKIEVKLAHADWRVESRAGYFAIPDFGDKAPLLPYEAAGLMTLNSSPLPHAFDFHTAAYQFRPGSSTSQAAVVFELPGAALKATPLPAVKKHRLRVALFAVVKDSSGNIVDKYGQDIPYLVPDDQLSRIQASPIDYTHAFILPPGRYTVQSVLFDRESKRASTSTVEMESPVQKGIGLSSLMVVARADPLTADADANDPFLLQGRDVVPLLDGNLKASAKPLIYFVVYPDKMLQDPPKIRVEFFAGGQELEAKDQDLPAPDSFGVIPMVVNAQSRPGKCEIRITARQGFESKVESVTYTVTP